MVSFISLKILVYRVWCSTASHLMDSLQQVIKDGGEGVVVRQPASFYEHGRSESLFKLKVGFLSYFSSLFTLIKRLHAVIRRH